MKFDPVKSCVILAIVGTTSAATAQFNVTSTNREIYAAAQACELVEESSESNDENNFFDTVIATDFCLGGFAEGQANISSYNDNFVIADDGSGVAGYSGFGTATAFCDSRINFTLLESLSYELIVGVSARRVDIDFNLLPGLATVRLLDPNGNVVHEFVSGEPQVEPPPGFREFGLLLPGGYTMEGFAQAVVGGNIAKDRSGYSYTLVVNFGDVNQDAQVSLADIPAFAALIVDADYQVEADFDQNGTVDLQDLPFFVTRLAMGQ